MYIYIFIYSLSDNCSLLIKELSPRHHERSVAFFVLALSTATLMVRTERVQLTSQLTLQLTSQRTAQLTSKLTSWLTSKLPCWPERFALNRGAGAVFAARTQVFSHACISRSQYFGGWLTPSDLGLLKLSFFCPHPPRTMRPPARSSTPRKLSVRFLSRCAGFCTQANEMFPLKF